MKVAFVVQRYGREVIGGAETHARLVAEQLVRSKAWQVDVYTTTALNYETWQDYYRPGQETVNGVGVRRFPSRIRRIPWLFKIYNRLTSPLLRHLQRTGLRQIFAPLLSLLEHLWFILQGPYCPDLIQALRQGEKDYQKIFFFTYLYYPTIYGLPHFQDKAVIIPTAHNEPPLYFPRCRSTLWAARVHLINTEVEKKLLQELTGNPATHYLHAGIGLDDYWEQATSGEVRRSQASDLPAGPYLLYLGRLSKGKGVHTLIDDYLAYIGTNACQNPPSLVLAGSKEQGLRLPQHPLIRYLGLIPDSRKSAIIAHASVLINPSPFESLSLIVLEALALKIPVLVNGECEVLKSYTLSTPTVLSYHHRQEFFSQLDRLLTAPQESSWDDQLTSSQNWVRKEYSWKKVLNAYQTATQI